MANYGTSLVMTRLSAECLVRPASGGTDVGVDLYCESVAQGRPFLHFWVQVKAGARCKVSKDRASARYSFKRNHLESGAISPCPCSPRWCRHPGRRAATPTSM